MKKVFFVFVMVATLVSCVTQKRCNQKFPTVQFDSTSIVTTHDTIHDSIPVPYQELSFDTTSPCPEITSFRKEIKKDWLTAIVDFSKDGMKFFIKSSPHKESIAIPVKRTVITNVKIEYRDKIIKEPIAWKWEFYRFGFYTLLIMVLVMTIIYLLKKAI